MTRTAPYPPLAPTQLLERHRKLMLAMDMSGQADLYAEDGVFEFPFAPPGKPWRFEGRERVREMLVGAGRMTESMGLRPIENVDVRVHVTADPEVVITELVAIIGDHGGGEIRLPYVSVARIREGEIVCYRDYATPRTAAVKLIH
jgi:ketosteroid isomerase-like protein